MTLLLLRYVIFLGLHTAINIILILILNFLKGLSEEEVEKRLKEFGHNAITPAATIPEWKKFVREFTGVFSIMLELAGLGCFANYGLQGAVENVCILNNFFIMMLLLLFYSTSLFLLFLLS